MSYLDLDLESLRSSFVKEQELAQQKALEEVALQSSKPFAETLASLVHSQVLCVLKKDQDGIDALAFCPEPERESKDCFVALTPAVPKCRTPAALDICSTGMFLSWKRVNDAVEKMGCLNGKLMDWLKAWEVKHEPIMKNLTLPVQPNATTFAALSLYDDLDSPMPPELPAPSAVLSIFDECDENQMELSEVIQHEDGANLHRAAAFDRVEEEAAKNAAKRAQCLAQCRVQQKKEKKHAKCLQSGLPLCRLPVEKFRIKVAMAIKCICAVKKCDAALKHQDKGYKQLLLDGFWCFAMHGRQVQSKLDEKRNPKQPPSTETHFWHVALVVGGLSQFNPTFHVCKAQANEPGDQPFPPDITLSSEGQFLSFYEALHSLDIEWERTLQIYQIASSPKHIGEFLPNSVQAKRLLCSYVVWKGLSAYGPKGQRRNVNPDPGVSGAVDLDFDAGSASASAAIMQSGMRLGRIG